VAAGPVIRLCRADAHSRAKVEIANRDLDLVDRGTVPE